MSGLFSLEGRRAMVTGANTGIGQGIAVALAAAGAEVLAVGRSSMAETEAAIRDAGGKVVALKADLARTASVAPMLDTAWEAHGPIDILVNNAGIIRRAAAVDFSEQDWDDVLDVNLKSVFLLSQAFARRVFAAERTGKIVNIASLMSFQGGIRIASYTAAKSGLAGLTRILANEWAAKGINVNAIAPGYIVTNNTEALRNDPERSTDILKRIPAGRWGSAQDIGGTAVYLASDAANYVHGAILPVDGGWLAR
ncbi:2-dehydro-3-deoxy-D-gluconate 5-dehydrogenase KduD [Mesorhizobium sp. J428]|uniref:2-dehydro-3-deoxy-D-gluconate 5-dehydrogenase KduD n=1 Tax=Mesorhizobium sp. J428 TaxID=2898440 RepID=UPI0021518915|nr:2-dehydro-3-deoxy-D-gluconate 5-dehydrogenase KduD [Mesorhizobium sp. J428]MCR5857664.1 2-dehydro-3-deoxy-D-gluconate 5-dehydrogenase KduD [Mesorhizobium sp. J428]